MPMAQTRCTIGVRRHGYNHTDFKIAKVKEMTVAPIKMGGIAQHHAKPQTRKALLDPACAEVVAGRRRRVCTRNESTLKRCGLGGSLRSAVRRIARKHGHTPSRILPPHKPTLLKVVKKPSHGGSVTRKLMNSARHPFSRGQLQSSRCHEHPPSPRRQTTQIAPCGRPARTRARLATWPCCHAWKRRSGHPA